MRYLAKFFLCVLVGLFLNCLGQDTYAIQYYFGTEYTGNNLTSRSALDTEKVTWMSTNFSTRTGYEFDFGTGTSNITLPLVHTLNAGTGFSLEVSLRDMNGPASGSLAATPAIVSFGTTMQDGAPKPQSHYGSSPRFGHWTESAGSATSRNAILLDLAGPIDGLGLWIGDVETRTDGSGAVAELILLDSSQNVIDTQTIPTTTSDQSLCGSPVNNNFRGCGSRSSRWIGIINDTFDDIKYILIVVGDDDSSPGNNDGNGEHLSFAGGVVYPELLADVTVEKTVATGSYASGDIATFTITYINSGAGDANNVVISEIPGTGFTWNGTNPLWSGTIAAGSSGQITVTGLVYGMSGDLFYNSVGIQTSTTELDTTNNTGSVSGLVILASLVATNDNYTGNVGQTLVLDLIDNDTNGLGTGIVLSGVMQPASGSTSISGNVVVYEPNALFCGLDTFVYTITDSTNAIATGSVMVDVACSAVAFDDFITGVQNTQLTIMPLTNDSDLVGSGLTLTNVAPGSHGLLSLSGDVITYIPFVGYCGVDTLNYTVTDGLGNIDTATIFITISCPLTNPTSGGGGGGGSSLKPDECPDVNGDGIKDYMDDLSPSRYDRLCEVSIDDPVLIENTDSDSTTNMDSESTIVQVNETLVIQENSEDLFHFIDFENVLLPNPLRISKHEDTFVLGNRLQNTGTPYELLKQKGINVVKSSSVLTDQYDWIKMRDTYSDDINFWLNILPYDQDKNANRYIVYPRLGIVTPVHGVPENTQDYQELKSGKDIDINKYLLRGIVQHPGSVNMGEIGNFIAMGHSSYYKNAIGDYKTIFTSLPLSEIGDEIWAYQKQLDGTYKKYTYRVTRSYVTNPENTDILSSNKGATMLLYTCTPIGTVKERAVVEAVLDVPEFVIESKEVHYSVYYEQKTIVDDMVEYLTGLSQQDLEIITPTLNNVIINKKQEGSIGWLKYAQVQLRKIFSQE